MTELITHSRYAGDSTVPDSGELVQESVSVGPGTPPASTLTCMPV